MQTNFAFVVTAAPLRASGRQAHARRDQGYLVGEMSDPRHEHRQRLILHPATDEHPDLAFVHRAWMQYGEVE